MSWHPEDVARTLFADHETRSPMSASLRAKVLKLEERRKECLKEGRGDRNNVVPCREVFAASVEILEEYRKEKGEVKNLSKLQILAFLFETVTGVPMEGPTKAQNSYWTTNRFNRVNVVSKLGEAGWNLTDNHDMRASVVGGLRLHAKDYASHARISQKDAFIKVLEVAPTADDGVIRGINGVTADSIRKALGLSPRPPQGQRRGSKSKPNNKKVEAPPAAEPAVEAEPKIRRSSSEREQQLVKELREKGEELIALRLQDVPEDDRLSMERDLRAELRITIRLILTSTRTKLAGVAEQDRKSYLRACQEIGIDVPKNGLCDFPKARTQHRMLAKERHPDCGGTDVHAYQAVNEAWGVIREYHEKYEQQ